MRSYLARPSPLFVANCRFQGEGNCYALAAHHSPILEVRNSDFRFPTSGYHVISWSPPADAKYGSLEGCILHGRSNALNVNHYDFAENAPGDHSLRLTRNTVFSNRPVQLRFHQLPPEGGGAGLRVEARGNVFDCGHFLTLESRDKVRPFAAADAEGLRKKFLQWQEKENLYALGANFLSINRNIDGEKKEIEPAPPVKSLAAWNTLWGLTNTGSLEASPHFQGGDIAAILKSDPFKPQPADFRLAKDSPGQGVLPGGKDLGADVDLVGPGPAYEKWKKTPEYQEWLKATGQQSR